MTGSRKARAIAEKFPRGLYRSLRGVRNPTGRALVIIFAIIFAANLPALLGVVDTDPFHLYSNLFSVSKPGVITGQPSIDPNNGFTTQALGALAARQWLHGHIPWWNFYEGLGTPLAGEMQSAAFFPPIILLLLPRGLLIMHIVLECTASVGMCFLGRALGWRWRTSVAVGVAFGLNGTFAWLQNSAFNPIAFLPLTLLGIERVRARQRNGLLVVTMSLLMSLLAGFPETALMDGLLAGTWTAVRVLQLQGGTRIKTASLVFAAALASACLSAPLLISFLSYLRVGDLGPHSAGGYSHVSVISSGAATLGMPYRYGPIFGWLGQGAPADLVSMWGSVGGFFTASTMLLAAIGLCTGRQNRSLRITLGAWTVIWMLRSFGEPTVVSALAHIPGASAIAVSRYSAPSCELAILILAGIGLESLFESRRVILAALAIAEALLLTVNALSAPLTRQLSGLAGYSTVSRLSVLEASTVFLIFAALAIWRPSRSSDAAIALVLIETVGAFMLPMLSAPRSLRVDTQALHFLTRQPAGVRVFSFGPLAPNYGSYIGVAQLNVNDIPIPSSFSRLVSTKLAPSAQPIVFVGTPRSPNEMPVAEYVSHRRYYDSLGIRYLLFPAGSPPPPSVDPVLRTATMDVYRSNRARSLFSEVGTTGNCRVKVKGWTLAVITCRRSTRIIWNEQYFSGWKAFVNNARSPVEEYDHSVSSVAVPAGVSVLQLRFMPPYAWQSAVLVCLGLLMMSWLQFGQSTAFPLRSSPPQLPAGARTPKLGPRDNFQV